MLKYTCIFAVLMQLTVALSAQIPNSGFENWTGLNPDGYVTCNNNSGVTNPVTKSTDHFPASIGDFSMRIENFAAGATGCAMYGFVSTALYIGYFGPCFPITGHPTSFYGYYKFDSQNNDTMSIGLGLYKNGDMVSYTMLVSSTSMVDWTSFSLPLLPYETADSAAIGFSTFFAEYGLPPAGPWGNSVMYVDNISFDTLVTDIALDKEEIAFSAFPNPARTQLSVSVAVTGPTDYAIHLIDATGRVVLSDHKRERQSGPATWVFETNSLPTGLYSLEVNNGNTLTTRKILVE